jgi:dTMP kinase
MFFSFDGIDGAGKSTQVGLFCDALRERGYDVVTCRDPGSTPLGERVRELLLARDAGVAIGLRSEMLLYMAARAQLVEEVIRPALASGRVVVSDRYLLANVVYQGHAGGLDPNTIREVGQIATAGLLPDCVFLLDMPPSEAGRRMMNRPLDRMESLGDEYRKRLQEGFRAEAEGWDNRIHLIDAARPIDSVHADIWQIAAAIMAEPGALKSQIKH